MSQSLQDRQRILEIVAQVLVIDFAITLEEDDFFQRLAIRLDVEAGKVAALVKRVNIGADIEADVAQLGDKARQELMKTLAEAAAVDGHIAPREIDVIERVGAVLGQ